MRIFIVLSTLVLLCLCQPAQAAFPVATFASVTVADTPVTDTTTRHHYIQRNGMHEWATHKKWHPRHDLAAWALLCAVLGIAAAVAFFYVLPLSVAGAITLFVVSGVMGFAAFGLSEMDILSAHPHKISAVSMVLGILEAIPLSIAAIPISIIWAFIPRTHYRGRTAEKKSK